MPRDSNDATPTTAFVFAGGGSLGAIQVGMLKALIGQGVRPDLAVGASVGSINAAYLAGRPDIDGVRELERLWLGLRRETLFPINLKSLIRFARRRDFLLDGKALLSLIEANLPYRRLEQAAIPIHVVTTNLLSGRTEVLSKGPAGEAILASCSIPAAFAAVEIDGLFLADGGLASNTPIATAVGIKAKRLVVLPTGYACGLSRPPRTAVGSAVHGLNLMMCAQVVRELESLTPEIEYRVVPSLCPLDVSSIDFTRTRQLIDRAYRQTSEWLEGGGMDNGLVPDSLRPHSHDHR